MRFVITAAVSSLAAGSAIAGEASISVDIPRLNVVEYHKPYVAFWLEGADGGKVTNLAVWYDVKHKDNEGGKWLKDMRQWWRRTGRDLEVPIDGVTGATKPAGKHPITLADAATAKLTPGAYKFVVEAAREVGGREVVTIPFQWPPAKADLQSASGSSELGEIKLELKP